MKTLIPSLLFLVAASVLSVSVNAGLTQDCMLQGTVKEQKSAAHGSTVFIKFNNATAFSKTSRCDLGRKSDLNFKQPHQSLIDTVSPGAKVKFRLQRDEHKNDKWQLIDVTI